MKKLLVLLALLPFLSMANIEHAVPSPLSDWTYGTCHFVGDQPQNCRSVGDITVWYNGQWESSSQSVGTVIHYYVTGDCCVAYPTNHTGNDIVMHSRNGSVQVQYYRK